MFTSLGSRIITFLWPNSTDNFAPTEQPPVPPPTTKTLQLNKNCYGEIFIYNIIIHINDNKESTEFPI